MCFCESRRTTNEGTLTICLPTLGGERQVRHQDWDMRTSNAPDVPLADENTSVVNGLGQAALEDLSLEATLQEVLDLQGQHVIQTHAGLVEHTDANETTDEGVTLEKTLGVLVIELEQLTGRTTDLGQDETDAPDLALVAKTVLAGELNCNTHMHLVMAEGDDTNAPSARHQDEPTRRGDGGPLRCKVIVETIMGHGYDQHGASLHNSGS